MADIIDTYIKKIDQYNINKKINNFFIYLRNIRDWLIKKAMVEIELFKIKLELKKNYTKLGKFIFKEHPLNSHYKGEEDKRDWLFKIEGEYLSFFKYWNKIRKKLFTRFKKKI